MHGLWDSIGRDLSGHGLFGGSFQFRLVLQPLAAVILGIRVGIKSAKRGMPPFLTNLVHDKGHRGELLASAARDALFPLLVALIIDAILQHMINGRIRPLGALFVGGLLVFLPFVVVRSIANRLWSHAHPGQGRPVEQSH